MAPFAAPFAERHAQVELCDRGAARVAAKGKRVKNRFPRQVNT
jgi:hypothetical protein